MKQLYRLCLQLIFMLIPLAAFAEEFQSFVYSGVKYTIYSEPSEYSKFGSVGASPESKDIYGDVSIPLHVEYSGKVYEVNSISDFEGCKNITSVSMPLRVSIDDYAFENCTSLSYVKLRNIELNKEDYKYGISQYTLLIPYRAFAGCSSLQEISVDYDEYIKKFEIRSQAFADCVSLASFNLGFLEEEYREYIPVTLDSQVFLNCVNLKAVTIGFGYYVYYDYLGESVFKNCENLSTVHFQSSNIKYILESCFENCKNLTSFDFISGVETIERYAFYGCSSIANLDLPNVSYIGDHAFDDCIGISKIDIPNAKSISTCAFKGCSNLTNFKIPLNIERMESGCFQDCIGLTEVVVTEGTPNPEVKLYFGSDMYLDEVLVTPGLFEGCINLEKAIIPQTCTHIGSYSFSGCTNLKDIIIPNSVEAICTKAFLGCIGLKQVEIPESVKIIGYAAFRGCSNLQSINLPEGVDEIYQEAFLGCYSVNTIVIPKSVRFIGGMAFHCTFYSGYPAEHCDIYYYTDNPITTENGDGFSEFMYEKATLHYLEGYLDKYETTNPWKRFLNKVSGTNAGIGDVATETDESSTIYNLDGILIKSSDLMVPGIYIRKKGHKTEKFIIR